jgi:hypothetical protein
VSPSRTPKQAAFMRAAAHNPKFAKAAKIPVSVAKEFMRADQKAAPPPAGKGRRKS